VHTLGNYLRQTGAEVMTLRSGKKTLDSIEKMAREGNAPDMVVLSPGPGNPSDFGLSDSIKMLTQNKIPGFGVCLGLQGMVEHFGGKLGTRISNAWKTIQGKPYVFWQNGKEYFYKFARNF